MMFSIIHGAANKAHQRTPARRFAPRGFRRLLCFAIVGR